jgi:IS6 family transposase
LLKDNIKLVSSAFDLKGSGANMNSCVNMEKRALESTRILGMKSSSGLFKWKHFEAEIILLTVRWYLQYRLSYRDLVEIMSERGISISHTTIMRWVHEYSPEIVKRVRPHLKPVNDSWRCDETYIKVKGQWTYLYRAVDSTGKTIDFMLSEKRDKNAAERFFQKALSSDHVQTPRVITVDKNPSYPAAIERLKENKELPEETVIRQAKYLNNIIEQDHRFIKKRTNPMLGFKSFDTAVKTIEGIETMHMINKGQVKLKNLSAPNNVQLFQQLIGMIA